MELPGVLVLASLLAGLLVVVMQTVILRGQEHLRREVADLRTRMPPGTAAVPAGAYDAPEASGDAADTAAEPPAALRRITVVLNPTKYEDLGRFRHQVELTVAASDPDIDVTFLETSRTDPGHGQAEFAISEGADLVIAAGGDGTVRQVASALAGSGTRMAIIPAGAGNLLARNLEIALDDVAAAVRVAVDGEDRRIDVGWLRAGTSADAAERAPRKIFLVIAGYGADAEMIGAAGVRMKKRIGWIAYVIAGAGKVIGRSHDVVVTLPDGTEHVMQARTVVIGNVGKLPGGIVLMPGATMDNGRLEVLALGWRGAAGFSQIFGQVMNPRLRARPKLSTMQRYLTRSVRVATSKPQPVQLDGDTEEEATHLVANIDAGTLIMRVPPSEA